MSGTLCLTFDNLGEAAEVGAGARVAPDPPGRHPTAIEALPAILELLAAHGLAVTFFLEGLNAELYPELLAEIGARGHELAFHAWTHEQWAELSAEEQAANLARGMSAFEAIGIAPSGMRPPGGDLGAGGVEILRDAGLRYCSPAGGAARVEDGVALLPFEWPLVDASCVIPELEGPMREAAEFHEFLETRLEDLAREGGLLTIVLHPFMLEWHGVSRLDSLLERIAGLRDRGVGVLRCQDAAELIV